jgi:hypothetical protein
MKKFVFGMNPEIQKAETKDYVEFRGLASTPDIDLQGEMLEQNGLDLSDLQRKKMYVIDNHGFGYPVKTQAKCGIIDKAEVTPQGLVVEGKIFKNHPASSWYIEALKHSPGSIQLSVEGSVLERDSFNPKKVKRAKIMGVALCDHPVNSNTYAELVKSFKGEADEAFFEAEDLPTMYTAEQVAQLLKSLGISQPYGSTPPAALTGGSAMQKENLDRKKLKKVTISDENEAKTEKIKIKKSISCEEFEEKIETALDLLQKAYPEMSRNELWEEIKSRLEYF